MPLRKATKEENDEISAASRGGDDDLLERFIAQNIDVVNARFVDWYNQTPLHLAAWGGHIDVATTLIHNGAEIDAKSSVNSTPLNVASYHGQCGILKLLLEHGADYNTVDWGHHTPLYWAARDGSVSITKELIRVNADLEIVEMSRHWTPLHAAAYHDNGGVVTELVMAGANLDAIDKDGKTPFHLAVETCNSRIVQYFIKDAGIDVSQLAEHLQLKVDNILMKMPLQHNLTQNLKKHQDISMTLDIEKSMYSKNVYEEFKRKAALSYEEALSSGERAANQFKLLLVGPEGAGKTSTVGSLLGKLFQPYQPTTIGADLNKCTVDRILVSKWKETNMTEHLEVVTDQYYCEMKTCMSQISRSSKLPLKSKTNPTSTYSAANLIKARKVIESKPSSRSGGTKIIMYDVGGQEIYQIFRCLFLASEDIVFIVFNASIGLYGHVKNRQRETRFKKKVDVQGTLTNLQAIETILNSIYSNSTDTDVQSISNRMPVIFLIATHSKYLSLEQKDDIKCTIYEKFSGRPFMDHLPQSRDDAIHFIDNAERDPKVFEHLKTMVMRAADCITKMKRPISYLQFESEILGLSQTKTSITTKEASEVASKCGINSDMKYVLHHFHHKGILQYYSRVKSLQGQVFISPQEISNNLSTVITTHNCMPSSAKLQRSCDRYETYGLLEEDFLDNLLVNAKRLEKKSILLGLLENFNLAVELPLNTRFIDEDPSYSTPNSGRVFLIPAMLTYNEGKVHKKQEGDIVILFHFPDKFLPEAVFNRVLVKTVIWSNSKGHEIRGMYHGSGQFDFKDHRQGFILQQCLVTFSIKCFITIYQHLTSNKQQLEQMLNHRQELIEHLKQCIHSVHVSCIPSAQQPIAYLECPFDHNPGFPPHIPLDDVSVTKDHILCRQNENRPIPSEAYILLLKASVYDDAYLSDACVDISNNTCSSVMDVLYQLNPELNEHVNMNSLIPYMNKYGILTKNERFYLNDSTKSPSDKVTYVLGVLELKDDKTIRNFVKALKEEKQHPGHSVLCSLLAQKSIIV